ncbi:sodium:solute symporter family protein [Aquicoccus sp. SCR17]|nr:sodium:solute symporter family protein [Carideicomes alvinocaridis]
MAPALVWAAIGLFTLFGLVMVTRAARANRGTAEDYFLGSRRLGAAVAGLSYAATTYSAFMLIVLTGLTYRGGIGALGFELVYFSGLTLIVLFGPRFWLIARRHGFVTPSEMLGGRFASPGLARLVAVASLLFLLPYCTTQMAGIGLLLSGVTGGGISLSTAVIVGAALALVWTLVAGLRSVAWTDAGQAALMMISALLAVGFVIWEIGGPQSFADQLATDWSDHLDVPGPGLWALPTFIALSLPWFFFPLSNPQVSQRLFMLRDLGAMKGMIGWVLGFGLVFTLISVTWGLAALILVPELENPAEATPALLGSGAVPVWLALLLILGILAAAVSTLDSIALTLASMVSRDLLPGRGEGLLAGRIVVVLVILFAAGFGAWNAALVSQLAAMSAAGLLVSVPTIVAAFFWRRATASGALASVAGGTVAAIWLVLGAGMSVYDPWLPVTVLGLAVLLLVAVSLATRPRPGALDFAGDLRPELERHRVW